MSAAPSGAADPAVSVFFEVAGFERVVVLVLAMVRILVAPDPEEALSFLSSPAHGLPFLWLFAIAKHVSNRPFVSERKQVFSRRAGAQSLGFLALSAI